MKSILRMLLVHIGISKCLFYDKQCLSPPVQLARWAHMHRFLSVCLDLTKKSDWKIIHTGKKIITQKVL